MNVYSPTEGGLEFLVSQFLDRSLPKDQWTHEAHLIVGLWHCRNYSQDEALCRLRSGIITYNQAVGTINDGNNGYHETLTQLWVHILSDFEKKHANLSFPELCSVILTSRWGSKEVIFQLYSRELLFSTQARARWIEPDRGSLP